LSKPCKIGLLLYKLLLPCKLLDTYTLSFQKLVKFRTQYLMSVVEVCWRPLVPWYCNDFRNILENLRVSNPHATDSEIQEAKIYKYTISGPIHHLNGT